jgi:hypothetical protein
MSTSSRHHHPVVIVLGVAALLVAFVESAKATMLVVIYTQDGFWLASDGYRSSEGKHIADVCKIHETRFGLLAKSGESQGDTESGEIYSTDKEVENLLAAAENFEDFQSKLRVQFKQDIEQELALLVDDPLVTSQNLERFKMTNPIPPLLIPMLTRTVIMFDTKAPNATGTVLLVAPQSDLVKNQLFETYYRYWAPSLFGWHPVETADEQPSPPQPAITLPPSIHEYTYLVSYTKTDDWVRKHPKQAITEILQQAHRESPEGIGPPYAIVHVTLKKPKLPKVKWVSKGVCQGWSDSVYPTNTLVQMRDELREKNRANQ